MGWYFKLYEDCMVEINFWKYNFKYINIDNEKMKKKMLIKVKIVFLVYDCDIYVFCFLIY